MVRVINNLAPGLNYDSLSAEFHDASDAVRAAAEHIRYELKPADVTFNPAESTGLKAKFGTGDWATTAEKMYFPTEPGVARPAWRVLIWLPVNAFYVIVDAETGTLLWRKNVTNDQVQSGSYFVFANSNAMLNSAESPNPLTPGPTTLSGAQGARLTRTTMTLIGNEAPYTFNNNGWITDGGNSTDGNAVEAGVDRDTTNGVDPASIAVGAARVFNFAFNPGNPVDNTGEAPTPNAPIPCVAAPPPYTNYQRAAATQMFYITNRFHDELYRLGFTEAARNFQTDNFGRGGVGNDRVSAEGQDCSGTNNANFGTVADGGRGRMQMYIWTGPIPDFDGTIEADIMLHELAHGVSQRLHGNVGGLTTNMASGMGEGWSDFYSQSLLSEPADPVSGVYTISGYVTYLISAGHTTNYYYGLRRYPKAVITSTGGANNKPHNAFTFRDMNSDCGTRTNNTFFAFARGPIGSATCDQLHNIGEIWSSALWEVRARFIQRLGWTVGNRKALQLVTDGMKLSPLGPTFLTGREAIIAAAVASAAAPEASVDAADVWAGFAARGVGFGSTIQNIGTGGNTTAVTQSFELPNLAQTPAMSVSDGGGNNNGVPDPGEGLVLTIPLANTAGSPAAGVTAQIVGGGSADYGTIDHGSSVTRQVNYTVPTGAVCGSLHSITINVNSSLGATSFTRSFVLGTPVPAMTQNFDAVAAPAFPAGWTAASIQSGVTFVTTTNTPDSPPNAAFALEPSAVGGGTDLTSPSVFIPTANAAVEFRHRFVTEAGWDGGVLELKIGAGAFQDIVVAGGTFLQNGYTTVLANGLNNPLAGRTSWNGDSGGYITTIARLPASVAGQNVQLRWRFGSDDNTVGPGPNPGWYVDGVRIMGSYACTPVTVRSRGDFDGDGRTDVSVFRPVDGNWYVNRSTAGFIVTNWGLATDIEAPGDFDGDNKTDIAVFRPSNGTWWILKSGGGVASTQFGIAGDIPVVGDYDGNGTADIAVFRPSANVWYIWHTGGGIVVTGFGAAGDLPARGDYNNDGMTDIAVYRPSTGQWWIASSGGGVSVATFGGAGDKPVPADYDGDNRDDLAVYRPSTGTWYVFRSTNANVDVVNFGIATDIPVPGDYDGDGRDDQAIYRDGTWWLNRSTAGVTAQAFGNPTDRPIVTRYIP